MQYMEQWTMPAAKHKVTKAKILSVFFDWDMTLAHVLGDKSPSERLAALFQKVGLTYSVTEVATAVAQHKQATGQSHHSQKHPPLQTQEDIASYYQQILNRLGYQDNNTWQLVNELYDAYSHLPTYLYEDVVPTFQALQSKGIHIGVISNHSTQVRPKIEKMLANYVSPEHIIISQEEQLHKPLPEIFHRAAKATAVAPQQCLIVGDNLQVDAIGSVQHGGFACGLWLDRQGDNNDITLPQHVHRITTLTQVLDFLI